MNHILDACTEVNKIREAERNIVNKTASQSVVKIYGWLKQFMAVSINNAGYSVGL
jgi:hypothetical protein